VKFDVVVFDWDGTLMNSERRIVACIQAAAQDVGVPVPAYDAAKDIIGLGLAPAIERLFPGAGGSAIADVITRYRQLFFSDSLANSVLFEGAREVLSDLAERQLLLAVATGKSRRGLDRELAEVALDPFFCVTRCADETFSKPHPQMLLEIMQVLGVEPQQTLMVGDTEYDMQMANNAGVRALGVGYGVHESDRLMQAGALDCLDDIKDLPAWLDRLD
jgi:phosphoglycolate phosphatase